MLTYPKSTMRVRRMPCIWVRATWLWCRGNFTPPHNFPSVGLRAPGGLTLGFAPYF